MTNVSYATNGARPSFNNYMMDFEHNLFDSDYWDLIKYN